MRLLPPSINTLGRFSCLLLNPFEIIYLPSSFPAATVPRYNPADGVPMAEGADDDDVPDLLPAWYFSADIIAGGQTGAETIMVQMTIDIMDTMNTSSRSPAPSRSRSP